MPPPCFLVDRGRQSHVRQPAQTFAARVEGAAELGLDLAVRIPDEAQLFAVAVEGARGQRDTVRGRLDGLPALGAGLVDDQRGLGFGHRRGLRGYGAEARVEEQEEARKKREAAESASPHHPGATVVVVLHRAPLYARDGPKFSASKPPEGGPDRAGFAFATRRLPGSL